MGLTGAGFLGLVSALGIAAFAAVVGIWPRWSRPGARAVVGRVALLGGVNLLLLLTVAVALNDEYGFFSDWTDLAGAAGLSSDPGTVTDAGAVVAGGSLVPGELDLRGPGGQRGRPGTGGSALVGGVGPVRVNPGTRVFRVTVPGPVSGVSAMVVVSLPAGYTDPAQQGRRYPVIEAFPGYPGGPFVPSAALTDAARQHRLADTVMISPVVQIPAGRDTECVDGGPGDPKVETWLTRDVPDWAARNLRVRTDRASWATLGVSAGGWCAAMASLLHPDRYGAAIVLGGYFRPDFGRLYSPFAPGSAQGRRYDLLSLVAQRPPPVAFWLQTSRADTLSYPTSAQFLAIARAPLSVQGLVLAHAGHRSDVWRPLYPRALSWLGTVLPPFAPGAS